MQLVLSGAASPTLSRQVISVSPSYKNWSSVFYLRVNISNASASLRTTSSSPQHSSRQDVADLSLVFSSLFVFLHLLLPTWKATSWCDKVAADPPSHTPCCVWLGGALRPLRLSFVSRHVVLTKQNWQQLRALVWTYNTVLQETAWHMLVQSISGCAPPSPAPPTPLATEFPA